jgi:hypothetical protein
MSKILKYKLFEKSSEKVDLGIYDKADLESFFAEILDENWLLDEMDIKHPYVRFDGDFPYRHASEVLRKDSNFILRKFVLYLVTDKDPIGRLESINKVLGEFVQSLKQLKNSKEIKITKTDIEFGYVDDKRRRLGLVVELIESIVDTSEIGLESELAEFRQMVLNKTNNISYRSSWRIDDLNIYFSDKDLILDCEKLSNYQVSTFIENLRKSFTRDRLNNRSSFDFEITRNKNKIIFTKLKKLD